MQALQGAASWMRCGLQASQRYSRACSRNNQTAQLPVRTSSLVHAPDFGWDNAWPGL